MAETGVEERRNGLSAEFRGRIPSKPLTVDCSRLAPRSDGLFNDRLTPITSYNQGSSNGSYTARGGETLSSIASAMWGDASLWYKLASANGLGSDAQLPAGRILTIPAGVMRNTNNASTFKAYNPADAYGDTSPTTPQPQAAKKNKCGLFGQVLVAVIAVAVSIALPGGGSAIGAAINAAIGSAVSQAFALSVGLQNKFDFVGVATAGVTAAAGFAAGDVLGTSTTKAGPFGINTAARAASALAGAAARSVITGTDFGDNIVAVLPDVIAQTMGDYATGVISRRRQSLVDAVTDAPNLSPLPGVGAVLGGYGAVIAENLTVPGTSYLRDPAGNTTSLRAEGGSSNDGSCHGYIDVPVVAEGHAFLNTALGPIQLASGGSYLPGGYNIDFYGASDGNLRFAWVGDGKGGVSYSATLGETTYEVDPNFNGEVGDSGVFIRFGENTPHVYVNAPSVGQEDLSFVGNYVGRLREDYEGLFTRAGIRNLSNGMVQCTRDILVEKTPLGYLPADRRMPRTVTVSAPWLWRRGGESAASRYGLCHRCRPHRQQGLAWARSRAFYRDCGRDTAHERRW